MSTRLAESRNQLESAIAEKESLAKIHSDKKKERDIMMSTHFKLIKANEKISSEYEAIKREMDKSRFIKV